MKTNCENQRFPRLTLKKKFDMMKTLHSRRCGGVMHTGRIVPLYRSIKVHNLADPSRLHTPKANYIVWMETIDNGTQNLGRLTPAKGMFSRASKGQLETVTPYAPLRFIITAEDQIDAQYPGSEVVLTSESNALRNSN